MATPTQDTQGITTKHNINKDRQQHNNPELLSPKDGLRPAHQSENSEYHPYYQRAYSDEEQRQERKLNQVCQQSP